MVKSRARGPEEALWLAVITALAASMVTNALLAASAAAADFQPYFAQAMSNPSLDRRGGHGRCVPGDAVDPQPEAGAEGVNSSVRKRSAE